MTPEKSERLRIKNHYECSGETAKRVYHIMKVEKCDSDEAKGR